ncbi:MAG: aminopeptidase family protein P [Alphaproteobacteria bacterium]|nr:aminopeptidase family protein P [Alphaproteobacteria bacterium]
MTLKELQLNLLKHKLDAYYIPRNTCFLEQDLLDEENLLLQLTGFSGSAGKMIITPKKAYLFVDGRYDIQAKLEVNSEEVDVLSQCEFVDFIVELEHKNPKLKIGFNPWTSSLKELPLYKGKDRSAIYVEKVFIAPKVTKKPEVFEHLIEFSGCSREEKISLIVEEINQTPYDAFLTCLADDVSWLLNLRSDYLPTSPIFRGYALVKKEGDVIVFSDDLEAGKFSGFEVLPLTKIETQLKKMKRTKIGICEESTPYAFKKLFEKNKIETFISHNFISEEKAQKNEIEIQNVIKAHIKDGVAVTKFLFWFEKEGLGKTELDIVKKLYEFRSQQENFFSDSFDTIAGFGENGAIVHYHPTEKTNKQITEDNFLLLDSGAQFLNGTTDVTRTLVVGNVSDEMKHDFTLVLKSHIALATAKFPAKINGHAIDVLARQFLWQEGKDYKHGTGHGVGFFLNVHEGPQSISSVARYAPMLENVVVSIEPGYYLEGKYGIRHENLYQVVRDEQTSMLKFFPLTQIPIDLKGIDNKMLSTQEGEWLKDYHQKVYNKLAPYLTDEEKDWLKHYCHL